MDEPSKEKSSNTSFQAYGTEFKIGDKYFPLGSLGKGSYGVVARARNINSKEEVAIKRISPVSRKTSDARRVLREIRLMRHLGVHPNIISLKDLIMNEADDELYVIMELMDTDLHKIIQSKQKLTEAHHKYFLHQLLRGVKYMHDNMILHRDLKPGNLLVSKDCSLKIGDFGMARKIPNITEENQDGSSSSSGSRRRRRPPMTERVVTRWYRPPELMLQPNGYYNGSLDMWSVGCIFAELLGRKPMFPGKNFVDQLTLIFNIIGSPTPLEISKVKGAQAQKFLRGIVSDKPRVPLQKLFPSVSKDALNLLDKMLQFNPKKRCTVDQALEHPFMTSLEKRYQPNTLSDPTILQDLCVDFDEKKVGKSALKLEIANEVSLFSADATGQNVIDNSNATNHSVKDVAVVPRPSSAPSVAKEKIVRPVSASTRKPNQLHFKSPLVQKETCGSVKKIIPKDLASSSGPECNSIENHGNQTKSDHVPSDKQPLFKSRAPPNEALPEDRDKAPPSSSGSAYALLRRSSATTTVSFQNKTLIDPLARIKPKGGGGDRRGRKKQLTKPQSPKFSVMSWERSKKHKHTTALSRNQSTTTTRRRSSSITRAKSAGAIRRSVIK